MQSTFKYNSSVRVTRRWLLFFIVSLFISGLTAIPLETELAFLSRCFSPETTIGAWIDRVYIAITDINARYPFVSYGYDWLAFAHFVLAILFIGPYKNPVRNKWVIEFGIIACLLVIPYALIAGHFRGIPFNWRLIDCSFGIVGLVPLLIVYQKVLAIEKMEEFFNEVKTNSLNQFV
jgi:hypothetical protein